MCVCTGLGWHGLGWAGLPTLDKPVVGRTPRSLTGIGRDIGLKLNAPGSHVGLALPEQFALGVDQIVGLLVPIILLRIGRDQQSRIFQRGIQVFPGNPLGLVQVNGKIVDNDLVLLFVVGLLLLLLLQRKESFVVHFVKVYRGRTFHHIFLPRRPGPIDGIHGRESHIVQGLRRHARSRSDVQGSSGVGILLTRRRH